jgi:hypothetical protein
VTITAQPNVIEISDFTAGYMPDLEASSVPDRALIDVLNLLPEPSFRRSSQMPQGLVTQLYGGALATRPGFQAVLRAIVGDGTHKIHQIFHTGGNGDADRLIVILSDGTSNAGNVQLHYIKMADLSHSRMDHDNPTRIWEDPYGIHWGIFIGHRFYGGTEGEPMYFYNINTDNWEDDASQPTSKAWVATGSLTDTSIQYPADYAFRGDEVISYAGAHYTPTGRNRYRSWNTEVASYRVGDKVSRYHAWTEVGFGVPFGDAGTHSYTRSYQCIQVHDPGDNDTVPGSGANWPDFWKKLRLDDPVDSDTNAVNDDWNYLDAAAQTSVAVWHGQRLWLRYDDTNQLDRMQFSAPLQPKHGQTVATQVFDPTDFAPGDDLRGEGGGWIPFTSGKGHAKIECAISYGQYLMVFKRNQTYVLSGTDEQTFNVRQLSEQIGAVSQRSAVIHRGDGMCYFLAMDGLYVTDGTQVTAVDNLGVVQETFRARMALSMAQTHAAIPTLVSHGEYVFCSVPVAGNSTPNWTMVYHPPTGSFWLTDLPIADAVDVSKDAGQEDMYFVTPRAYGYDNVYKLGAATTDDVGGSTLTTTAVTWRMRSSWLPFSTLRSERRIRRTWALIKGALTYTLTAYRNYNDSDSYVTTRTETATYPAHIEGQVIPDSHAIAFQVSGSGVTKVLGLAVDTEPRRPMRYHTG